MIPPRRRRGAPSTTEAADVVQPQVRVDRDRRRRRPAMIAVEVVAAIAIVAAAVIAVEDIAVAARSSSHSAWTGMGSVRIGIGRHTKLMMMGCCWW